MMEDLANSIMAEASSQGVELTQIRINKEFQEEIRFRNGNLERVNSSFLQGIGIRVRVESAWGFASIDSWDKEDALETLHRAIKVAKASARIKRKTNKNLVEEPAHQDTYIVAVKDDPFKKDLEEKVEFLKETNLRIKEAHETIRMYLTNYQARKVDTWFFSSEGAKIHQVLPYTGAQHTAIAVAPPEIQRRSLENFQSKGWEAIEELDLFSLAEKVGKEAAILATEAKKSPSGVIPLILEPYQLGLTIHESLGHPTELDRVLGYEADFAGTSFMTPEKLGTLRYGNEKVTMTNDPTMSGVLAHYKYDDEGTLAKKFQPVKEGIFLEYQSDREHAGILGREFSTGNSKAQSYRFVPIIRMANLYMEPDPSGYNGVEELIEDTKYGVYGLNWKSHSISDKRVNFQFATQMGYLIEKGEIKHPIKNLTYQGITTEFWNSVSGMTRQMQIWGLPYCGKGAPMQVGYVSHGGPWTRFDNVRVGISD